MNPYLLLAALAAVITSGFGGFKLGVDHEFAAQAREDQHIAQAVDAANAVSAEAISKIKVKHTTIQNELETQIRTEKVFLDCRLPPESLRLVNASLFPEQAASPPALVATPHQVVGR